MADQDFNLDSGAKLHVTVAPFQDAKALSKALIKSVGGVPLSDNLMNMDMSVFKDILVNAATSDEVESALVRCMERATYNGIKVNNGLFDDPTMGDNARKDYFLICTKIVEVNCLPFFEQALSKLKTSLTKNTNIQK